MASQPPTLQQLKGNMKATWMAGDFGKIAAMNEKWGEDFVARLDLKPGMLVLDVACGTGNQSIPAARTGARVTGIDIAPNLLSQARARADHAGVFVDFVEGDAEELPFPDARFDVVFSMFGAMFAPRPERVASELKRVCKPGGLIAMANWTPESVPGQMFGITARYLPPPPALQPPANWGVDGVVRERFGNEVEIHTTKQKELADYGELSPAQVVEFFRSFFGPTKMAFERMDPSRHPQFAADLERVFMNANQKRNGATAHEAEYLEVHGRLKN